jgi:multidrug efflux pump subunit AcrB
MSNEGPPKLNPSDQVETEKAHGRDPWDAVVEATAHRFRPILVTTPAAILGMVPIAPTIFWGPMAYAIMGAWRWRRF